MLWKLGFPTFLKVPPPHTYPTPECLSLPTRHTNTGMPLPPTYIPTTLYQPHLSWQLPAALTSILLTTAPNTSTPLATASSNHNSHAIPHPTAPTATHPQYLAHCPSTFLSTYWHSPCPWFSAPLPSWARAVPPNPGHPDLVSPIDCPTLTQPCTAQIWPGHPSVRMGR